MSQPSLTPQQLLSFYREVEKLKTTLRHSWLNDGKRQESVAEHTWMMSMLALVLMPQVELKLDQQKVLKMIILHDLAEAVTEDMPVWQGTQQAIQKAEAEKSAMDQILAHLDKQTAKDLLDTWQEYEDRKSAEALFVKALDTLDVISQHNVAPIETWDDNDYLWQLSPLQNAFFDVDELLRKIKNEIDLWSIEKVKKVNKLYKLDQTELKKRIS